jgi:V/A-type H+/Na+-transporting ATPase subunit I
VSIVQLSRITLAGCSPDKKSVLKGLQELGCLHIIPLTQKSTGAERNVSMGGREALRFLLESPQKFKQVTKDVHFDPLKVEEDARKLRDRLDRLINERDNLVMLIEERRPWGDFKPQPADDLRGQRLWLYSVPTYQRKLVESSNLCWQIVAHDNRFDYIAVVAEQEPAPEVMPFVPIHSDQRSLSEMETQLEELEIAIAETQVERVSMSRWCLLLAKSLDRLDDEAELERAQENTRELAPVFALQGWIPNDRLPEVQAFAEQHGLVFEAAEPDPSEVPPTKFHNPEQIAGGEELVSFYMTPSYWLCDPSPVVFFSFSLFFAMIMSDAGYGLLLALFTLAIWKRMGTSVAARRWRVIGAWMSGLTVGYGILVGSYFGVEPKNAFLKSLHLIDMKNYNQMMLMSALIGGIHVIVANLLNAWRYGRNHKALAPVGWAIVISCAMTLLIGSKADSVIAMQIGKVGLGVGFLLIVLFTAADEPAGKRILGGLLGLTKVTSAFGDVLSYLRLFALGLASASLAGVFNEMAGNLYRKSAAFGLVLAIGVLLFGHIVNLLLSISSGFIHGLRLNVIEFFNWGVQEEGNAYRPFMRKETAS